GAVAGEEADDAGDLVRVAEPVERHAAEHPVLLLRAVVERLLEQLRARVARGDRVHPDVRRGALGREHAGEAHDPGLRRAGRAPEALLTLPPPRPCSVMRGIACEQQRNIPVRCTPITACQSSKLSLPARPTRWIPALLTSTSTAPSSASTDANAASTLAGSE